jgi:hypothetical protein
MSREPDPNGWYPLNSDTLTPPPPLYSKRVSRQEVIGVPENAPANAALVAAAEQLGQCDGYIVLAVDPQTGEVDAHGPYDGLSATLKADRLRHEFDEGGLTDVSVGVVRLHTSP